MSGTIVIAGDSWGLGEWDSRENTHGGLAQYLQENGYPVVNVSEAGTGLKQILDRIKFVLALKSHINPPIRQILIFQTEWQRDFSFDTQFDRHWHLPEFYAEFDRVVISRWYSNLSELATKHNIKIGIMGGLSDAMYMDDYNAHYPGLYLACQSMASLCLNDDPVTHDPVFVAYVWPDFLELCRSKSRGPEDVEYLLGQIDKGLARTNKWKRCPEYFFPDGAHTNRHGHLKLFNFLQQRGFLDF